MQQVRTLFLKSTMVLSDTASDLIFRKGVIFVATTREPIGYEKAAIKRYAAREKTILQLAQDYSVPYEKMRRLLVKAGYSHGLKVR